MRICINYDGVDALERVMAIIDRFVESYEMGAASSGIKSGLLCKGVYGIELEDELGEYLFKKIEKEGMNPYIELPV